MVCSTEGQEISLIREDKQKEIQPLNTHSNSALLRSYTANIYMNEFIQYSECQQYYLFYLQWERHEMGIQNRKRNIVVNGTNDLADAEPGF